MRDRTHNVRDKYSNVRDGYSNVRDKYSNVRDGYSNVRDGYNLGMRDHRGRYNLYTLKSPTDKSVWSRCGERRS